MTVLSVSDMLDNAAIASQDKRILDEPSTRGAILRSFEQWLESQDEYDPFYHEWISQKLQEDPDYQS